MDELDKIPNFSEIKDKCAQQEGYKDWNDMLRCLFDPSIGHPGMYTLDDIVNNCLLDFYSHGL